MANKSHRAVLNYIDSKIKEAEATNAWTLLGSDRELLVTVCLDTLDTMIAKFVVGGAKHKNTLNQVNPMHELHMELIDALVYHAAMRKQFAAFGGGPA